MISVAILGSTGSVGRQSADVVEHLSARVTAITGGRNTELMERQIRSLKPKIAVMADAVAAEDLRVKVADTPTRVYSGKEALIQAAVMDGTDVTVSSIMGTAGLMPTLAAVKTGRRVAIANKESLVCAGEIIMHEARESGSEIIPVDSEHSAIFQSLRSGKHGEIKKLWLTASGGPFFGKNFDELENVTPQMALAHPNWKMGAKITVDCATLMNKGLEFIEAMRLFNVGYDKIDILVHRESVIHSMVEFADNSVIAQLGQADMRLPIQYALTYPDRVEGQTAALDLAAIGKLSFFKPDTENFRCLDLALEAARRGGNITAALSAANEIAVDKFLSGKAGFNDIYRIVSAALSKIEFIEYPSIEEILQTDSVARAYAAEWKKN